MAVQHRAIGADAERMCTTMHIEPLLGRELALRDRGAHALREHLCAAAGHRLEAGIAQPNKYILNRCLLDAGEVRNLDCGERLDLDTRVTLLETADQILVVGYAQ